MRYLSGAAEAQLEEADRRAADAEQRTADVERVARALRDVCNARAPRPSERATSLSRSTRRAAPGERDFGRFFFFWSGVEEPLLCAKSLPNTPAFVLRARAGESGGV